MEKRCKRKIIKFLLIRLSFAIFLSSALALNRYMHASRSRRGDDGVTNFYFLSETSAGGKRALYTRQQRVEQSLKHCHHCLVSSAVVEPSAHRQHSSVVVGGDDEHTERKKKHSR